MKLIKGYRKEIGYCTFVMQRFSGFALIFYVVAHLSHLVLLTMGEAVYNRVVVLLRSPVMLLLEGLVVVAIQFHILNGIRLLLINGGIWLDDQQDMAWVVLAAILILFIYHFVPLVEQYIGPLL